MWTHILLFLTGTTLAWMPIETSALSSILLSVVLFLCVPWVLDRVSRQALIRAWLAAPLGICVVGVSLYLSWDIETAISELGLVSAIAGVIVVASRSAPPERLIRLYFIILSGLALWGLWQVVIGFDQLAANLPPGMDPELEALSRAKLARGRAFASLILPGHFGALMAMILPFFLNGICRRKHLISNGIGLGLGVLGLVLSGSILGAYLATGACAVIVAHRLKPKFLPVVVATVFAIPPAAIALHCVVPRLLPFEAISLRLDNWKTALWLFSTAPATGIGLGSYGQASQSVPFAVGNRPQHAHSLPFELLAEFGLAGIALGALGALGLFLLVSRLWKRRPGLAVALAVIPIHNLADFSLHTSAVAIPWALLLGWGIAVQRSPSRPTVVQEPNPNLISRIAVMAIAGIAVLAVFLGTTSVFLDRAALAAETAEETVRIALKSSSTAPWRTPPLVIAGEAAVRSGNVTTMRRVHARLENRRRLQPHSGLLAGYRSQLSHATGNRATAIAEDWMASRFHPAEASHLERLRAFCGDIDEIH